jgi:cardiolipin synthase
VVDDVGFAAELRASLQAALDRGAQQVRAESWHRRPWAARAAHWTCYGFARLLTGVFAYGQAQEFT